GPSGRPGGGGPGHRHDCRGTARRAAGCAGGTARTSAHGGLRHMADVVALVFDFDDTLAPDSTTGFLEHIGVDTAAFWKEDVGRLLEHEDWDPVPAYLYRMIELSRSGSHGAITRERFERWGEQLPLHDGVETLFDRLRSRLRKAHPQVQLEFYLISSGIGDVLRRTPIAAQFTDIWASE